MAPDLRCPLQCCALISLLMNRYQKYFALLTFTLCSLSTAAVQVCNFGDHWDPHAKKYNYDLPCWDVLAAKILPSSYMHVEVELKKEQTTRKIVIHTSSRRTSERLVSVL